MKLLPFTVLVFWGFLSQVFVGQNVPVVAGQKGEFGQRQLIPTPGVGVPVTPMASFAAHEPTAGISNQGRAAISSSSIEFAGGASSTLTPPALVYQNATIWSVPETPETPAQSQEETKTVDLGPSSFVGFVGGSAAQQKARTKPG